jgi:hypothetical protein
MTRASRYLRQYRQRKRARGVCYNCWRRAVPPFRLCAEHRNQNRESARAQWAQHARQHPRRCLQCHKPLSVQEQQQRLRYHRARCIQQRRMYWNMTYQKARWQFIHLLPRYRAAHLSASLAYKARHRAQGLCLKCPRRSAPGVQHCRRHRQSDLKPVLICRQCHRKIPQWWRRQGRRVCPLCRISTCRGTDRLTLLKSLIKAGAS